MANIVWFLQFYCETMSRFWVKAVFLRPMLLCYSDGYRPRRSSKTIISIILGSLSCILHIFCLYYINRLVIKKLNSSILCDFAWFVHLFLIWKSPLYRHHLLIKAAKVLAGFSTLTIQGQVKQQWGALTYWSIDQILPSFHVIHSEKSPARPILFYSTNYWQQFWLHFVV